MTFRAQPVKRRSSGSSRHDDARQQLIVTLGFIVVIAVGVLTLGGVVVATYYGDHLAAVATIDGTSISRDQWNDRQVVDQYRYALLEQQITSAVNNGQLDQATADQEMQYVQQQVAAIPTTAVDELIDAVLQQKLAGQKGITVTQADVDAQLTKEATAPEQRKVLAIFVAPGESPAASVSPDASPAASAGPAAASAAPTSTAVASAAPTRSAPAASPASASPAPSASDAPSGPTAAQKAEAKSRAEQALAALDAGKPFDQVATEYSTDSSATSGGNYGYVYATDAVDEAWIKALFSLSLNGTTGVVEGADGTYRIGRVVDIVPAKTDGNYQKSVEQSGVNLAAYRAATLADLYRQRLSDRVTAEATTGNVEQVHAWEIKIGNTDGSSGAAITGPQVQASHILYSPKGDPSTASSVPADDPSWAEALKKARAAAARLRAIADPTARAAEFATLAKAESNDTSSGATGGDLGWFSEATMVKEFADAVFTGSHAADEIIGPVKSQYGYHVILFVAERPAPADRVTAVQQALAAPGADFAAVAKANSDAQDAAEGGDMGWIARLQDTADVEKVLFGLQTGQVSAPVTQSDGVYIYRISERAQRPVDASQKTALESSAFTYWYDQQKSQSKIWRSPDVAGAATTG
jgi:parvulin-like peptidyl-prolyl isomerase